MKFKVTECFYSIQGEGLHVGTPSVFLRMFGCNFKCEGFGMPPGEKSTERLQINPINFKTLDDLPLVTTGCDSYASWDPRFKDFAKHYTAEELSKYIDTLLEGKGMGGDIHLVITGGEPLLGWQKLYPELLETMFLENKLSHVTFETNGTQKLTDGMKEFMHSSGIQYTFSVSAKLSASGESPEDAIKPEIVADYADWGKVFFKFVVDQHTTIKEIKDVVNRFRDALGTFRPLPLLLAPVYLMPEGGTSSHYNANARAIADLCLKEGYRYSPRLHIDLFGNAWGT